MVNFHPASKLIAVHDKNGNAISILKEILNRCGRNCYRVAPAGEPSAASERRAVLLVCNLSDFSVEEPFETCVVNYDFAAVPNLAVLHPLTYSIQSNNADFTARNIRNTPDGFYAFEVVGVGVIGRVKFAATREEQVETALAAAAAAIACGIPFAEVLAALNSMKIQD